MDILSKESILSMNWLTSNNLQTKKMNVPFMHINLFNAILALYLIGYQITICTDWSWIPMNDEDYKLPYQGKWNVTQ